MDMSFSFYELILALLIVGLAISGIVMSITPAIVAAVTLVVLWGLAKVLLDSSL